SPPWRSAPECLCACVPCTLQEGTDLLVSRLRKRLVPSFDAKEVRWRHHTHHASACSAQLFTGRGGCNRDRHNDACWMLLVYSGKRCAHCRAGCNAVIDQDDGLPLQVGERPEAAIEPFATGKLALFFGCHRSDDMVGEAVFLHDIIVE